MLTSSNTIHSDEFSAKYLQITNETNGTSLHNDVINSNSTSPLVINMSSASSTNENDDVHHVRDNYEVIQQRFALLSEQKKVLDSPDSTSSSNSTGGDVCTPNSDHSDKLLPHHHHHHHRVYSPPISHGSSSSVKSLHSGEDNGSTSPSVLMKISKVDMMAMSPDDVESRSSSHERSSYIMCNKSDTSSSKTHQRGGKDVIPQRKRRDFIPDELKDEHYWERRRKNNLAAKRSREKRRLNDIVLETKVLELNMKSNILKFKLDLVLSKFQFSEDDLEVLYDENKHLFVNVQENLGLSELTSDSQHHNTADTDMTVKDLDTANSSCSSINENNSSGEESACASTISRIKKYRHGQPPEKKKAPSIESLNKSAQDAVTSPESVDFNAQQQQQQQSENMFNTTSPNKEVSKTQYPLLYTQLCKAMSSNGNNNNKNCTASSSATQFSNLNIPNNIATQKDTAETIQNIFLQQQQQQIDNKAKNDAAAMSLANLRTLMSNVSRECNQQTPRSTPTPVQLPIQNRADFTSQKLINTLINEYFRHDKNTNELTSQQSQKMIQPPNNLVQETNDRSSHMLNHQIEKYKNLINKTSNKTLSYEQQTFNNNNNNNKQESQRSRKRNFQSVSKIINEQHHTTDNMLNTNLDGSAIIKNNKIPTSADMYMEQLLAKYTQPVQRMLVNNANEMHVAHHIMQQQQQQQQQQNAIQNNGKYVDENLEIYNENLINLNQTAQQLFLQELKAQQQQQQQHQQHLQHQQQINNMKSHLITSPFTNNCNTNINNNNNNSNANANANGGDNMPLKLRFKMLHLKSGEVN